MQPDERPIVARRVQITQILAIPLILGPVIFLALASYLRVPIQAPNLDQIPLSLAACVLAGMALIGQYVVPNFSALRLIQPVDETAAVQVDLMVYQMHTLVAFAILEGAAIFAIIAYYVEGTVYAQAVAGFLIFCMTTHFPSMGRVEAFFAKRAAQRERLKPRD